MASGMPNNTGPSRRASDNDEGRGNAGTGTTDPLQEALLLLDDMGDILRLEPRAMEILGRDLLFEIVGAGRDQTVGTSTFNPHPATSAAHSGEVGTMNTSFHEGTINNQGRTANNHGSQKAGKSFTSSKTANNDEDTTKNHGSQKAGKSFTSSEAANNDQDRTNNHGSQKAEKTSTSSKAASHSEAAATKIASPLTHVNIPTETYNPTALSTTLRSINLHGTANAEQSLSRSEAAETVQAKISNSHHNTATAMYEAPTAMYEAPTALSTNYRGDPSLADNHSATIAPSQSTSLFIKGLPPNATIPKIVAQIHNTGKIFALHLNPPTPPHHGCAAKICFFSREAASKFYQNTRAGFWLDGHSATVVWNRVLVAEHVGSRWEEASRVVIVRGPRAVVSMATVADIVHQEIRIYDLTRVYDTDFAGPVNGFAEVEVHFGSFRAQAQSAFIVLNRALHGKGVTVRYGVDPCA